MGQKQKFSQQSLENIINDRFRKFEASLPKILMRPVFSAAEDRQFQLEFKVLGISGFAICERNSVAIILYSDLNCTGLLGAINAGIFDRRIAEKFQFKLNLLIARIRDLANRRRGIKAFTYAPFTSTLTHYFSQISL